MHEHVPCSQGQVIGSRNILACPSTCLHDPPFTTPIPSLPYNLSLIPFLPFFSILPSSCSVLSSHSLIPFLPFPLSFPSFLPSSLCFFLSCPFVYFFSPFPLSSLAFCSPSSLPLYPNVSFLSPLSVLPSCILLPRSRMPPHPPRPHHGEDTPQAQAEAGRQRPGHARAAVEGLFPCPPHHHLQHG